MSKTKVEYINVDFYCAEVYEKAEKLVVLVPMERRLEAFESLLSANDISEECLEVAPKVGIRSCSLYRSLMRSPKSAPS